jgi:hypothetical protein
MSEDVSAGVSFPWKLFSQLISEKQKLFKVEGVARVHSLINIIAACNQRKKLITHPTIVGGGKTFSFARIFRKSKALQEHENITINH